MPLLLLLLFVGVGAEVPSFLYKKNAKFAAFDLQQDSLYFHKDSDNLRLIVGKESIRMAYKSADTEIMPFPRNFRIMEPQEKIETVKAYRDFFRSELAVMLQTFVYTAPELFNWDVEKFKAQYEQFFITEKELYDIFSKGIPPKFYTILKFKCKKGETVVFESDANGNFFMEIELK